MSELETTITVVGVRDALATLRKVDPKLRSQATRELKAAGSSLLEPAKRNYPMTAPLSGWKPSGRLGYTGSKVQRGVQIRVGGRTPKGSNTAPVITIVQANAGGALFDIAGLRNRSGRFVRALESAGHGKAQRGLWAARDDIYERSGEALREALDKVVQDANRALDSMKAAG